MEYLHPLQRYLIIILLLYLGYGIFIITLLAGDNDVPSPMHPTTCENRCAVILPNSSVDKFKSFSFEKSQALFVHFHGINLSRLEPQKDTEILDPVNLVWVESITAPFLSLDFGFNVYSLTTLWRTVYNMSVMVDFDDLNCLQNISYSCITASLATAFLTDVSQQRGALCYVVKFNSSVKYKCCKIDLHTQKIECDIPASINPQMSGIFDAVVFVATILFVCFPAVFVSFPEEDDSSQTLSNNTQVRHPLYRIANFVVQKLRHLSTKYYCVNMVKTILIGGSLPMLFYIDLGLTAYTAKYDIPKMFNNAVRENWLKNDVLLSPLFTVVTYNVVLLIVSLLPRTENLHFSFASAGDQEKLQNAYSLIRNSKNKDFEVDWMKPCAIAREISMKLYSGFKELHDSQISICSRIILYLIGLLYLLIYTPFFVILIFIGYGLYISPLGRMVDLLFCHAHIYFLWFKWCFETWGECSEKLWLIIPFYVICMVLALALFFLMGVIMLSFSTIVSQSLLLIARLITYLCMGIVASKDDFLPLIALFSLFVFYIWNCFSSVGNAYKDLLDQTFDKCKEYQENENREIIMVDDEGTPRIPRLSVLFQKVVDKIHPFSKAYTIMCVRIAIIGSFLFLTYFAILLYGKTSLNDVTKTLAVSLAGLIPKLIEIFRSGNSKDLIDKENAYRVEKAVKEFFHSGDREQGGNAGETSERSSRNDTDIEIQQDRGHVLVRADVNPRLADINGDSSNETTPLLQSRQNTRDDITVV